MPYVRDLLTLGRNDVSLAGGKGASLGEMALKGLPVPPGFVVTAEAFDRLYDHPLPNAFVEEIFAAFDALDCAFVAVRSSATAEDSRGASWAGELATYLNTTREQLLERIQQCWSSLFSDRAVAYRYRQGLVDTPISVAVVIQKMIQSDVSGITFTVHPVTKDTDVMIIEACFGLGELIVGGIVTPDTYIVRKSDQTIIEVTQNDQHEMLIWGGNGNHRVPVPSAQRSRRKLNDDQVRSIAQLCVAIETHYGFPCDIEWAMENGMLYILQSRPITTL